MSTTPDQRERALREKIEELEEHIIQLKDMLVPRGISWPIEWKLPKGEAALLTSLFNAPGGFRSKEALLQAIALYPDRLPNDTLVNVRMSYLKKRVPALRGYIRLVWAKGYELTTDGRAFLRQHVRGLEQQAA